MAYRCSSCGHFTSLEEPELDADSAEFDGENFSVTVTASYPSACCGEEVGTADYEIATVEEFPHKEGCKSDDAQYSVSVTELTATDRFQTTDRRGKPIKNFRYQRHYYGVEVTATVTCETCGMEESISGSDESGPPEEVY